MDDVVSLEWRKEMSNALYCIRDSFGLLTHTLYG